ncbi:hypothetical protein, partial [Acidovorax sp. SUPP1855]|uniref:hypothetical protein n=1 Tax=Acidovorax sp. SUPP1855 TaxID=431774 RepID=UPI0024E13ABB
VLARGLSEQVELQGATGSDHGKGWSTRSRSTRDRMGFERFPYRSPITKGLTHRIDEYINIYRPTLVRARPDSSCLFPSRLGDQIRDIGEIVNRIAKSYIPEVRRLRLHALRHIVATDFLLRNPGKYTLLAGLLHDTLATVLKTYAHGKTESAFRAHEENMAEFYQGL